MCGGGVVVKQAAADTNIKCGQNPSTGIKLLGKNEPQEPAQTKS